MYNKFDEELSMLAYTDKTQFEKKWEELTDYRTKYLNHVKLHLNSNEKEYKKIKFLHDLFQIIIIVGTIIIPLIVNIQEIPILYHFLMFQPMAEGEHTLPIHMNTRITELASSLR